MTAHVIREGMQVLGSDGGMIGEVDGAEAERIKLKRGPGGGPHHFVPLTWVARVDDHVHLDRSAAIARDSWVTEGAGAGAAAAGGAASAGAAAMGSDDPANHKSAYGDKEGPVGSQRKALPWLLGVAALILLTVFLMRSCGPRTETEPQPYEANSAGQTGGAAGAAAAGVAAGTGLSEQLQAYLAGSEATGRAFALERLNFETGSADIRPDDQSEIMEIGRILQVYPNARIRVVGYTDARGESGANQTLAQRRAESVAGLLAATGIDASRLETAAGGESDPLASNASQQGQAANRRTEIVVLAR